jgi:FG-GAP-like repeat
MKIAIILLVCFALTSSAAVSKPVLKWKNGGCTNFCETNWYSSPAILPDKSVVVSSYTVSRLNGNTGDVIWQAKSGHAVSEGLSVSNSGRTWSGVVVADVNGDSNLNIVTAHQGTISAYDLDGEFISGWPIHPISQEIRSVCAANIQGDGKLEIGAGFARGNNVNSAVFESDGDMLGGWPQREDDTSGYSWGVYGSNLAMGTVDQDDLDGGFVLVPSDVHYVGFYTPDGKAKPANSDLYDERVFAEVGAYLNLEWELQGYGPCGDEPMVLRSNFARGSAVVVDVDGDGTLEFVITGNAHDCSNSQKDEANTVFIFNTDRSRWKNDKYDWDTVPQTGSPKSSSFETIEDAQWHVAVADIDGTSDGEKEILFPAYDGKLHCYWLDGTEHHSWPYTPPSSDYAYMSEPAIVDLDNDGRAEIIIGTWTKKNSNDAGELIVLDYKGEELHRVSIGPVPDGHSWDGILSPPSVGQLDDDADLELVVLVAHQGAFAFDLPDSANARVLWATSRGSLARNGIVGEQPPPVANPPDGESSSDEEEEESSSSSEEEEEEESDSDSSSSLTLSICISFILTLIVALA